MVSGESTNDDTGDIVDGTVDSSNAGLNQDEILERAEDPANAHGQVEGTVRHLDFERNPSGTDNYLR